MLLVETGEPGRRSLALQLGLGCLRQGKQVLGVSAAELLAFAPSLELLPGVLAQGREHRQAQSVRGVALPDEALLDQRFDRVEARVAHRLGRLGATAAGEDGEPREDRPLVRVEQLVTPVDRRPQRLLALREVARAADEDAQPSLQPGAKRLGREHARPRGRELERQRQPVERDADLGDLALVPLEPEVRSHGAGAGDEERHRLALRERLHVAPLLPLGQREGRDGIGRARRRGGGLSGS